MAKKTTDAEAAVEEAPPSQTLSVEETPAEQQARLKRAVEGVQKILTENRAVINCTRLNIIDGRIQPEIQIQILK